MTSKHKHDPLQPHEHDPNPKPPSEDPTFTLSLPDGNIHPVTVSELRQLPETSVANCYIVSTGHGTSGPFTFNGVQLLELISRYAGGPWSQVEVLSADGFGNRVFRAELENPDPAGPILLAYGVDDEPMSREQGLVRMVVPSERDDALRQVKWVAHVNVKE